MVISLRLDKEKAKHLESVAKAKGVSKSELIRECLGELLRRQQWTTAWETGKDLFGRVASGNPRLARDRKHRLRERFRGRARRR